MPGAFPYARRYHYPHMRDEDRYIWERFITGNPNIFETVDYDVAVGKRPDFSTVVTAATGGDNVRIYKKKIDVVAFKGNEIFIIELKPRAGSSAFGQVLGYVELYKRDIDPSSKPIAMVITDVLITDAEDLAKAMGIILKTA